MDIRALYDLELFLDVRVKESAEVEAVRALLIAAEVGDFIPVQDVALAPQRVDGQHLRKYGGKEEAGVSAWPVADVDGTIVPGQAYTGVVIDLVTIS